MIEINLIKGRALTKEDRDSIVKVLTISAGVVILIFTAIIIYYLSLASKVKNYESESRQVATEIKQMSRRFAINEWQAGWQDLMRNVKHAENIFSNRKSFTALLTAIGRNLPDDMYIREIMADYPGSNITIDLLVTDGDNTSNTVKNYVNLLKDRANVSDINFTRQEELVIIENKKLANYKLHMSYQ